MAGNTFINFQAKFIFGIYWISLYLMLSDHAAIWGCSPNRTRQQDFWKFMLIVVQITNDVMTFSVISFYFQNALKRELKRTLWMIMAQWIES